jgi:hypothetical protein
MRLAGSGQQQHERGRREQYGDPAERSTHTDKIVSGSRGSCR